MDYINDRPALVALLEKHLKGEKLAHSFEVEKTAIALAKKYGADINKAGLAGLLHDITKQMDNNTLAEKYGITSLSYKTLHGKTAAIYLEEHGITSDRAVLNAIKYHTTGKARMSLLDKIIYIADYIEPLRDFEEVEELRILAEESLDKAVLFGLSVTIRHLLDKKSLIEPESVKAYNYYMANQP